MRLWDRSEVTRAAPYLRSVIGSLREHWLEVFRAQRQMDLLAKHKAPARRQQILDKETRADERQRAEVQFEEALEELTRVDVLLLDPVRGLALIPFRQADDLAWYIFDHFAPHGVIGWRFHGDPIEECRPLTELKNGVAADVVAS